MKVSVAQPFRLQLSPRRYKDVEVSHTFSNLFEPLIILHDDFSRNDRLNSLPKLLVTVVGSAASP